MRSGESGLRDLRGWKQVRPADHRGGAIVSARGIWRLPILAGVAIAAYIVGVRPWHRRWGATLEKVTRPLPGDGLPCRPSLSVRLPDRRRRRHGRRPAKYTLPAHELKVRVLYHSTFALGRSLAG
jgi:hypothetical protein